MKYPKRYINYALMMIIAAIILQRLFLTQKYIADKPIITRFFLPKVDDGCYIKTTQFAFFMPQCEQYQPHSLLEVTGSLTPMTDKGFFKRKRLEIRDVKLIALRPSLVKHWWQQFLSAALKSKTFLLEKVTPFLPPSHAQLVAGMVFGGSDQLDAQTQAELRTTGLTHVVSASGYNVSIVAGLMMAVLRRLCSRRLAGLYSIMVVWFYAAMAELVPPVVRAAVMLSLNLLATQVFFRQARPWWSLFLASGLMLYFEPGYAQSLSFWLSILATWGIILILPLLEGSEGVLSRWSTAQIQLGERAPQVSSAKPGSIQTGMVSLLRESWQVTLAAQSLTLPLVAVVFSEVSWLSLITNTLLLWLTPLITLSGLGLMSLGSVLAGIAWILPAQAGWLTQEWWPALAPTLAILAWLPAELFLTSVAWFGQWEWGLINLEWLWLSGGGE